jgi:hypothetical protein
MFKGTREFICADEKDKMTEAQYKQAFPFRGAITESKALNRAIRGALMIKQAYKVEELQKPFAVPIVVPDATDPDMKAAILERYRRGTDALYSGGMQQQALNAGKEAASLEGDDDALDAAIDAEFSVPSAPEPPKLDPDMKVCDECQAEIVDFTAERSDGAVKDWTVKEWIAFTKSKYNAQLCPKCFRAKRRMEGAA